MMTKLFTAPLLQMWPWVTSVWSGLTASCSMWWHPPVCEPTVHCVVYPLLFEPTVQSTVGSNNNRYKHYILIWTQLFIIPSMLANYLPYQVNIILISCWVTIILMKELRKFTRFIDFFTCKKLRNLTYHQQPMSFLRTIVHFYIRCRHVSKPAQTVSQDRQATNLSLVTRNIH